MRQQVSFKGFPEIVKIFLENIMCETPPQLTITIPFWSVEGRFKTYFADNISLIGTNRELQEQQIDSLNAYGMDTIPDE